MKIKFMRDFGKYMAGEIVEVSEEEADDHHQAGRAAPFHEDNPKYAPVEVKLVVKKEKTAKKK